MKAVSQLSVLYKSFTILHLKEKDNKYSKLKGEQLRNNPSPAVHHPSPSFPCSKIY